MTSQMPLPTEAERQDILAQIYASRANRSQRLQAMKERQKKGLIIAREAAELLRTDFGVTRVSLFGSLTNHERMHIHSDIDLAVFGLPQNLIISAAYAVNDIERHQLFERIDLVRFESAPDYIQKAIDQEGILLWSMQDSFVPSQITWQLKVTMVLE